MQSTLDNKKITYGFYCPVSNKFYYVESKQVYLELLSALTKTGASQTKVQICQGQRKNNECEQKDINQIYSNMVDEDINDIFNDPLFQNPCQEIQLKQYDF